MTATTHSSACLLLVRSYFYVCKPAVRRGDGQRERSSRGFESSVQASCGEAKEEGLLLRRPPDCRGFEEPESKQASFQPKVTGTRKADLLVGGT